MHAYMSVYPYREPRYPEHKHGGAHKLGVQGRSPTHYGLTASPRRSSASPPPGVRGCKGETASGGRGATRGPGKSLSAASGTGFLVGWADGWL